MVRGLFKNEVKYYYVNFILNRHDIEMKEYDK